MQVSRHARKFVTCVLALAAGPAFLGVPAFSAAAADGDQPTASTSLRGEAFDRARAVLAAAPSPAPLPTTPAAAPRAGATTETVQFLDDTIGETDPRADIQQVTTDLGTNGLLSAVVTVTTFTDPTSNDWRNGDTMAAWGLDTDGDGVADARLVFMNNGTSVSAGLFSADYLTLICVGAASWSPSAKTYGAAVPIGCVGNVPSVRWTAHMQYEVVGTGLFFADDAPNVGWVGPFVNSGYVPPGGKLPAGSVYRFKVTGRNGVPPSGVAAVSLNVTVDQPDAAGHVTVYPCGSLPIASNLNHVGGQTVPNAVIAPVSPLGEVCFFTLSRTHLLADVNGWFPSGSAAIQSIAPTRVFDTRVGTGGVPAGVRLAAGGTLVVQMTGRNGVPGSGVAAVSLNVTVESPEAAGYITVYPCGNRPLASSLNYVAGQTVPNAVLAPVSADGKVCFYSSRATHLLADVNGWFPANPSGLQPLGPTRVVDTRAGLGKIPSDAVLQLKLTGANGVPVSGVGAVSLNVTVTEPDGVGHITVYPCGGPPLASNLNYVGGQTVANAVLVPLSGDGNVCFFAKRATHLVVDLNGWFPVSAAGFQPLLPSRLFDTRG